MLPRRSPSLRIMLIVLYAQVIGIVDVVHLEGKR